MNKDYARSIGKLTKLKKTVGIIKKELKTISEDKIENYLSCIILEIMRAGGSEDDAKWIIAYATELEKI